MGLNPETSHWKKVVSKAEFIEMAESVDLGHDTPEVSYRHGRDYPQNRGLNSRGHPGQKGKGSAAAHPQEERKQSPSPSSIEIKSAASTMGMEPGPKERRTATVCPKRKRKSTEPRIGALDVEKQGISPEIVVKVNLWEAERLREEALGQTTEGLSIGMITIPQLANKESGTSLKSTYPKRPPDASESAGDYYNPVELIDPWEFGEDENLTPVDNSEEKLALVLEEERKFGRPRCLGNALKRRLDYNLEWLQPYPGDPTNILQY
ncbi:hypothetical protein E4T56_gene10763 [Termitomyces sp. T112]|nr:hypothetical protein E4T56_gene10763 [Termitomyces sp. T112]